ncbi:TPA: hypothetical protein DEG21_00555 [Patescibacteria group bacterium]|nr:hypothetical protein [Candidatus Gracilibacteria bacterium]
MIIIYINLIFMDKNINPFPTLVEQRAHLESDKSGLEDLKKAVRTRTVELTQNPELVEQADKIEYSNFSRSSLLELI